MAKIKAYLKNPSKMFNSISDKIINQHEAEEAGDMQESDYNFRDVKKVNDDLNETYDLLLKRNKELTIDDLNDMLQPSEQQLRRKKMAEEGPINDK